MTNFAETFKLKCEIGVVLGKRDDESTIFNVIIQDSMGIHSLNEGWPTTSSEGREYLVKLADEYADGIPASRVLKDFDIKTFSYVSEIPVVIRDIADPDSPESNAMIRTNIHPRNIIPANPVYEREAEEAAIVLSNAFKAN